MRVLFVALLPVSIAACTTGHVAQASRFTPTSQNEFVFTADAYLMMQEADARAEGMRRELLDREARAYCPKGYDIIERRVADRGTNLFGKTDTIYYRGRCKG